MVKIEEVADDAWSDDDSSSIAESDVGSTTSFDDSLALYDPSQETFSERFYALKDMIPPTTRDTISNLWTSTTGWGAWSANNAGKAAWIACTSAILVGLPLVLAIEGESMMLQQESQYLGQAQAAAQGTQPYGTTQAPGQAQPPQGQIVPPGF